MSLTKSKVFTGLVNIVCYGGDPEAEVLRIDGLKKDTLNLNVEDIEEELEDATTDLIGRKGVAEYSHSELDPADLALINDDLTKIEFEFPGKSKKVTFTKPATLSAGYGWMVRPKVESGKTKIVVNKTVMGDNWPFTVGAMA